MKKNFFALLIGFLSLLPLNFLHAMEVEKIDQGPSSPPIKHALSLEEMEQLINGFSQQLNTCHESISAQAQKIKEQEEQLNLLKSKCSSHDKILERNPPLRRIVRVGSQFWAPIVVGGVYYVFSRDISTSLAIASYGMSILFVSWNQTFRADDTYYPVTRTIVSSDKKQQ